MILAHIKDEVLDAEGRIDPFKLDAVARMGGDWYCRANGEALFTVPKPLEKMGIGIDQLPEAIRKSNVLTGNDLAMLANVESFDQTAGYTSKEDKHRQAQDLLKHKKIEEAWAVLKA